MRNNLVGKLFAVVSIIGLFAGLSYGQSTPAPAPADPLSGRYEGVAKSEDRQVPLILELKKEGNKITGRAISGDTTVEITEATFVDGTLTLKFGELKGSLIAKVDGETMLGDFIHEARKGKVELKRVAEQRKSTLITGELGTPNLTGEWEAVADANGEPFPFTLMLKVEGDKVTGSSSSQLGESAISTGTWKDGQLNFTLDSPNGIITMNATVIEGKLSGLFDFAGQLQGKWVAVKRK